jgi:hypothetical protein
LVGDDSFGHTGPSLATPSQYGFVRGGGGATFDTADTYTGNIGLTTTILLDDGYNPANGATITLLIGMFRDNGFSPQTQGLNFTYRWTYNGTNWNGALLTGWTQEANPYPVWFNNVSGYFNQLSAAVVPGSGLAAIGTLGLAGVARRRRR